MTAGRAIGLVLGVAADGPRHGRQASTLVKVARALETRLNSDHPLAGVVHASALAGSAVLVGVLTERIGRRSPVAQAAGTDIATWAVLGAADLVAHGTAMARDLEDGKLPAARHTLASLDPKVADELDTIALSRASVESLAEHLRRRRRSFVLGRVGGRSRPVRVPSGQPAPPPGPRPLPSLPLVRRAFGRSCPPGPDACPRGADRDGGTRRRRVRPGRVESVVPRHDSPSQPQRRPCRSRVRGSVRNPCRRPHDLPAWHRGTARTGRWSEPGRGARDPSRRTFSRSWLARRRKLSRSGRPSRTATQELTHLRRGSQRRTCAAASRQSRYRQA